MKFWKYILMLVATALTTALWAQELEPEPEPQPEPVVTTVIDTVYTTTYRPTEYQAECSNHLPWMWRGQDLRTTGTYRDTVVTSTYRPAPVPVIILSDTTLHDTLSVLSTIYSVEFTVNPTYSMTRTYELRKGSKIEVRGKWYNQAGTYYDTIPSTTTCDSILQITIIWAENFRQVEKQTICEGNTITWHGRTLSEEGIYTDSLKTVQGYDSIFQLYLYMHYAFAHHDTLVACARDTSHFLWHDIPITDAGDYQRTYIDQYGCDSTYYLHFDIPSASATTTYTTYFCRNQGFVFHHTTYYTQQTFTDTLTNLQGCDSVVVYRFIPRDNDFHTETIHHDAGVPVSWQDSTYAIDGIYRDTLINRFGCDSILELRLVTQYNVDVSIIRCEGDTVMIRNRVIDHDCDINDTLKSVLGGDSIIHLHFSFKKPFHSREEITICSNEYVEWTGHNKILHAAGVYYDRHRTIYGCDSTYEILVRHAPAYLHDSVVIICNDSIDLHPISWTDSKGHTWTFHQHNLDTTIIDTMRHTEPKPHHYDPTLGDPISGGCDSIFRFRVIVTDRCSSVDTLSICPGGGVWVDGRLYTEPGLYSNTMPSKLHPDLNLPDSTHTFYIWQAPSDTTSDTVTVCESKLPIYYHGKRYASTKSGDYRVTLTNRFGCDSVVNLHINVIPTVYSPINYIEDFCPGDSIYVKTPTGKVFTQPGTYTDTVHYCEYGCDSIIRIQIAYKPSFFSTETKYLRRNDIFRWTGHLNDIVLDSAGTYYDSCVNVFGCDSVYQLRLIYAEPFYKEETAHVCHNQLPLMWHRKAIHDEGVYWDSLKTIHRLDSVYKLTVTLDSAFSDTITYRLCDGDVFTLKGKKYTTSGIYIDKLSSVGGCDSIVYHIVNFSTAIVRNQETLHCAKDSFVVWHGQRYNREGTYFDTIHSSLGCDSILYSMRLKIEHPFYHYDSIALCHSQLPYEWHNRKLTLPGIYYDSCKTIYQLDSVYCLKLDTLPDSFASYSVSICRDSSYNFYSQVITEAGVYIHHMVRANGCDSAVRCIVNIAPQYLYDETLSYVDESELPILWHGKWLDHEGYFYDSLQTVDCHCDSIHRVHLVHLQRYFFSEEQDICDSQLPFAWHGLSLTEAGVYTKTYTTHTGVDSVYQITLTVNPSELDVRNVILCQGQTYNLHGWLISEPGVYRDTMFTEFGCYAITEVHISRPEPTETVIHHLLCAGDSITIDGRNITTAGNYYVTTQSLVTGCDSTILHVVTLSSRFFQNEQKTIQPGETYIWHRQGMPWPLSESGTYFDSCKNIYGCDSIYRLELVVNRVEYIFPTEYVTVCADRLPYIWHHQTIQTEGIYYDRHKTILGNDSVYTLALTIYTTRDSTAYLTFCEGERPTINGTVYTRSASFTDTLARTDGCDSVRIHYVLNFYPSYSLTKMIELRYGETYLFGDTVIATSGTYFRHFYTTHGCDSLVTLHVAACPTVRETLIKKDLCEGEVFMLNGDTITSSGRYTNYLSTADGCDSLVVYLVNFHPSFNDYRAVSICHGETYRWVGHFHDTVLTKPGLYIDSIPTESGCYNTYSLQLSFKNNDFTDTLISLCADKLPYIYKGQKYFVDSVFYDTIGTNIQGCDSIRRWHYEVNYHCSPYDQYKRCSNETKYIEGLLIDHAGVYAVNRLTAQGEDSIYRFIVNDVQPYERFTPLAPGCDSITYKGVTYYARGAGRESFQVDLMHRTIEGCDSLEHLMLTIHTASPTYTEVATIADFQTYQFEHQTFNTPGTHVVRHLNQHNCDSIRQLILTVLPTTYHEADTFAFCSGDRTPIKVFDSLYYPTRDTIIYDTLWISGMPHIFTALVNQHYPFTIASFNPHTTSPEVCADYAVSFDVDYSVTDHSAMPEYYEYYFVEQDLEVKHDTVLRPINGRTTLSIDMDGRGLYIQPGYYTYRIRFSSPSCGRADTSFTSQILVRYPAEVMQANWNNVVTLVNEDYNIGNWIFQPPYSWQVFNSAGGDKTAQVVPSDHAQPYLASNHLAEGDQITALLYRKGYSLAIPSCTFTFTPQAFNPAVNPIAIYPTATAKSSSIHVQARQTGSYQLYNSAGDKCSRGAVCDGDNLVSMPASAGCYLMQVTLQDGSSALQRVIVY